MCCIIIELFVNSLVSIFCRFMMLQYFGFPIASLNTTRHCFLGAGMHPEDSILVSRMNVNNFLSSMAVFLVKDGKLQVVKSGASQPFNLIRPTPPSRSPMGEKVPAEINCSCFHILHPQSLTARP